MGHAVDGERWGKGGKPQYSSALRQSRRLHRLGQWGHGKASLPAAFVAVTRCVAGNAQFCFDAVVPGRQVLMADRPVDQR